jgi:hypothetical protein
MGDIISASSWLSPFPHYAIDWQNRRRDSSTAIIERPSISFVPLTPRFSPHITLPTYAATNYQIHPLTNPCLMDKRIKQLLN